jgi:hypothetical protein
MTYASGNDERERGACTVDPGISMLCYRIEDCASPIATGPLVERINPGGVKCEWPQVKPRVTRKGMHSTPEGG